MRLIKGLAEKELIARITRCERTSGLSERGLGFYLLDFHVRGLCRKFGFASTAQFACIKLQIPLRRTRELLRMARALEDLPRLDDAYAKSEVTWSAVRELTRVATPDTEEEWLDLARKNTLRTIERAVAGAARGERPPRDPYTLSKTRLKVMAELSVEDHAIWQAAFERIAERSGHDLDASTALTVMAKTFLEQPLTESEAEARKAFQIVYHRCTECDRAWVMTDEGPQGVPARKVEERRRDAQVIRLDAERLSARSRDPQGAVKATEYRAAVPDDPRGARLDQTRLQSVARKEAVFFMSTPGSPAVPMAKRDRPNSVVIRQQVLGRDGSRCAVPGCTNRGHLASHHIIWREQGGLTEINNEVSVCRTCHSLIHEGFLFVTGEAPNRLFWLGPDRLPLESFWPEPAPDVPDYEKVTPVPADVGDPRGAGSSTLGSYDTGLFEDTSISSTIDSLDEVPGEVSAEWWEAHKHNFIFKGNRILLNTSD